MGRFSLCLTQVSFAAVVRSFSQRLESGSISICWEDQRLAAEGETECSAIFSPQGTPTCFTCEGDVESFVGHGKIGNEADLGGEVAIESGTDGGRQPRASQLSQGL